VSGQPLFTIKLFAVFAVVEPTRGFSRRAFLGGVATAAVVAATVRFDPQLVRSVESSLDKGPFRVESPNTAVPITPASPVLPITVERDTDLLLADFTFYGFSVDKTSKPPCLKVTAKAAANTWIGVTVRLPPQAIAEGDYPYPPAAKPDTLLFDPTPVVSQVSGPTMLAFTFATGDTIPLPTMTPADLLDWSGWDLYVPQTAVTGSGLGNPIPPLTYQGAPFQTVIECPIDLLLSPVVDGQLTNLSSFSTQFENRSVPFTSQAEVTECWTTSLTSVETIFFNGVRHYVIPPAIAAVWANDYLDPSDETDTGENYIVYYPYEAPPP